MTVIEVRSHLPAVRTNHMNYFVVGCTCGWVTNLTYYHKGDAVKHWRNHYVGSKGLLGPALEVL